MYVLELSFTYFSTGVMCERWAVGDLEVSAQSVGNATECAERGYGNVGPRRATWASYHRGDFPVSRKSVTCCIILLTLALIGNMLVTFTLSRVDVLLRGTAFLRKTGRLVSFPRLSVLMIR